MATATDEQLARIERRLARAAEENAILERMIEDKTRSLYLAQGELEQSKVFLENVLRSMHTAVLITDPGGAITSVGGTTSSLVGVDESTLVGQPLSTVLRLDRPDTTGEGELLAGDGATVPVIVTTSELTDEHDTTVGTVYVATDISERKRLEVELRHAQRLESIGQLAAGVAHEINTPIQFVSDSVRFLSEVLDDLMALQASYQRLRDAAAGFESCVEIVEELDEQADEIDLEFVRDETPKAVDRTLDGLNRVATIVKALKRFSHPGDNDLAPADLNEIIDNTLTVAKNEYKYVAEVEVEAGDLRDVVCNPGDLGQVFLNLVVNAAQAIADRVEADGSMGTISIRTVGDDHGVTVAIGDTGGGIPAEVQERVFEPFFTTKEPGKGTGQGLALAHNVIVNKHGGRLSFEVEAGVGTTFLVWLPYRQSGATDASAA